MGFFSGLRKAGGYVFNFRVDKWVGYEQIKRNSTDLLDDAKTIFIAEQADHKETFEEALKRLNLSEAELQARAVEFRRLMLLFLILAGLVFGYSFYIGFMYKNVAGFFMGIAVTIFALANAFRYHFWLYQIKHKKLGCTLREWFADKR